MGPKKTKVMWGNNLEGYKEIGVCIEKQTVCIMQAYLKIKMPDFKSYYYRYWQDEDGATIVDYGSHCFFFKLVPITN